jgi:NAD(P)-dependent dehydrogenase (short-subunit alcohol dehydrogenase family)
VSPGPGRTIPDRCILDRFKLDGRVAVITGASSGLGAACALAFAAAGADLVLGARRAERLCATADAARALGCRALTVPTDVTSPADCERLVVDGLDEFGRIDVLVNGAGVASSVPALREEPREFRRVIDVNLMGSYWMAEACARVMQPGSSIVNISSVIAATTLDAPQAAYTASKAAIEGVTRDLAQQWTGPLGIRVNAVAPGFVMTELTASAEPYVQRVVGRRALTGRCAEAIEVAAAILFLASNAASYITGFSLPVDGGMRVT